jgi:hypothetical protein
MLHHRAGYDSIELQEATSLVVGGGSDESEIHPQIQSSFRPHLLATKRALLYSLVFLGVVVIFATDLKFDIPLLGQSLRKHYAQSVADDFILTYLAKPRELKREHKPPVHYSPEGCEATVVIVRHCEKGSTREHCSYNGYERSVYLSTIFGDGDERWPTPSYIFALDAGKRHNSKKRVYREMETVLPLAVKSNVQVDYSYDVSHSNQLGEHMSNMLHSGEVCGKVAVICWKHSDIPHLAHKLGCGPTQGCPADYPSYTFDQAWQIKVCDLTSVCIGNVIE